MGTLKGTDVSPWDPLRTAQGPTAAAVAHSGAGAPPSLGPLAGEPPRKIKLEIQSCLQHVTNRGIGSFSKCCADLLCGAGFGAIHPYRVRS